MACANCGSRHPFESLPIFFIWFQTLSSGPVASASASIVTSVSSSSVLGQQHGYTYSTAGLRLGNSNLPLTASLAGSLPAAFTGSLPPGLQGLASSLASSLSLQVYITTLEFQESYNK